MKNRLRLLILTDFIHKEQLNIIGSNHEIGSIGVVPIFESLRRALPTETNIAVLSGTLVILKTNLTENINEITKNKKVEYTHTVISETEYSIFNFTGNSKNKVEIVTELFQLGKISILIGTKSLLGEGWDSPVINTLILASFVGSFMLSNQMRGRAIRLDPQNPNKVANIWHLVTLPFTEQNSSNFEEGFGNDFETLERRFMNFFAPNLEGTQIQVGLNRLGISKNTLDQKSVELINQRMIDMAKKRELIKQQWQSLLGTQDTDLKIVHQAKVTIPKNNSLTDKFIFTNILSSILISFIMTILIYFSLTFILSYFNMSLPADREFFSFLMILVFNFVNQIIWHFGGRKRKMKAISEAICDTMRSIQVLNSSALSVMQVDKSKTSILFSLENTNEKESHEYVKAISEFFSVIENPRYILYQVNICNKKDTYNSYACPSIFSIKQEYVQKLVDNLNKKGYRFNFSYTRNQEGRKILIRCRNSYTTHNNYQFMDDKIVKQYKKTKNWR